MAKAERFEDLRVWQEARRLANDVYDFTQGSKDYRFVDQIRAAATSVMNNVAEGFERKTDADFAHFLSIAKGSAGEVRSMLFLAEDRKYLSKEIATKMRTEYANLSGGLAQLAKYLRQPSKS